MPAITFFDSKDCEWSDQVVHIGGTRCAKIQGVRFGSEMEKEYLRGEGRDPLSIQSGNRSYPGELKVTKMVLDNLNKAARIAGGKDVLDIAIDIVVTYKAKGARALQTFTLVGCEFEKNEQGMDQGAKNGEITIPFKALDIVYAD